MSRRWWSLVAVSLATFMTYLDNNVTNVAIPTIERSLHLSLAGLEWVVSSYILVFAGLLLAAAVPDRADGVHLGVARRRTGW
jgi:MFS family permease